MLVSRIAYLQESLHMYGRHHDFSLSEIGRPPGNNVAVSFFASINREEIYRTQYKSELPFRESIDHYIDFHNTQKPYSTLSSKTQGSQSVDFPFSTHDSKLFIIE